MPEFYGERVVSAVAAGPPSQGNHFAIAAIDELFDSVTQRLHRGTIFSVDAAAARYTAQSDGDDVLYNLIEGSDKASTVGGSTSSN